MAQTSEAVRRPRRSWWVLAAAAIAALAVVGLALVAVALRQIRAAAPEAHHLEWALPPAAVDRDGPPTAIRLEVEAAQLVVVPGPAGDPIRVAAEYDPASYTLTRDVVAGADGRSLDRVRFGPTHSAAMALLRIKLGQRLPELRVTLPRDLALVFDADVRGSFAAVELGGLRLAAVDVTVAGGAATVSFLEPTAAPLERFAMRGDKGSVEVTGLGHASPQVVDIEQRFGELDLDLRGAWVNDAEIRLGVRLAGGGVWLPDDVVVEGLEDRIGPWLVEVPDGRPRLHVVTDGRSGRLVFVH